MEGFFGKLRRKVEESGKKADTDLARAQEANSQAKREADEARKRLSATVREFEESSAPENSEARYQAVLDRKRAELKAEQEERNRNAERRKRELLN